MPKLNLPILASLIFAVPAAAQTTERVSVSDTGAQADSYSSLPVISADGRYVAFHSRASTLVPGDTNGYVDVFLRDRQMGTTTRISVDHLGGQLARGGFDPSISADGRFISFGSHDDFVVPGVGGNARTQVFVYDRITGQVECASVNVQGVEGNQVCTDASISADGRMVAFESLSSNLTPGDTNDLVDVFVRDMHTGEVHRASVNSLGDQTTGGASLDPSISCDGRMIAFQSSANNLASGLNYDGPNIYVHDLVSGQTRLVSVR